ncbi:MAG: M48 family metalloprotease [Vulcanimicrobiota bacterium]
MNPAPIGSNFHPQALTFKRVKETSLLRDVGVRLGLCQPTQEADLNADVFSQRYCQEVQRLVPGEALANTVEQAYALALAALPPLQAAALAGQVALGMVSPQAEQRAAECLRLRPHGGLTRQVESACQRAGVPYPSQVWVVPCDQLEACSSFGGVAVSSLYLDPAREARLHFVVGHELSHGRNRDDIAMMGFEALSAQVTQPLLAYALKQDLRELHHQMEYRCDREGLRYARAQGLDPADLQYQLAELLDQQSESDTHPSGGQRLQALRRDG